MSDMLILSGSVELLLLLCLMASWTCDVMSCMEFVSAYYSVGVVCFIVLLNYLLLRIICLGVQVAALLLNVMVLLCVWICLLLLNICIVFHSVCVFCMWSHFLFPLNVCIQQK